jgi:hypothetical protein
MDTSMPVASRLTIIAGAACALALPAAASAKKVHDPHRLPAHWQHRFHVSSATADHDGDGLSNWTEFRAHTSPKKLDTDHDGVDDDAEDRDRDGLDNASEQRAGTDPAKRDSDRDGLPDAREDADRDGLPNGAEEATANDPSDPDSDDDGIKDGQENAGQVVAFADGVLRLRLAATGKVLTAPVAGDASVECGATDDYEADFADGTSDDPADGTSDAEDGAASDDSGDDQGQDGSDDEDEVVAMAAVIRSEDDGYATEDYGADVPDLEDSGDAEDDSCIAETLDKGAWVHEAELSSGDAGLQFDTVLLVEDD